MSKTKANDTQVKQYVSFVLDGEEYGVSILNVKEIIRYESLTRLPQSADFIEGVLNLRGQVIPVVNLRKKFDFQEFEVDRSTRIIVVEVNHRTVGMVVDQVSEVLQISDEQIAPPPPMGSKLNTTFISGMGKLEEKLLILLDIDKILTMNETAVVDDVLVAV